MLFRYDFGEKLDLSRFRKQAPHYIGNMREITYHLFLSNYKLVVEIAKIDDSSGHAISLYILELKRDDDNDFVSEKVVIPLLDNRFKELKIIQDMFNITEYRSCFESNSSLDTVEKICNLIKILFKINSLKVFL